MRLVISLSVLTLLAINIKLLAPVSAQSVSNVTCQPSAAWVNFRLHQIFLIVSDDVKTDAQLKEPDSMPCWRLLAGTVHERM
jgi:hypothetical protein